mmetsp:Transcript_2099/g.4491  ORF Transcript_2099/g.4491 Transcript_2099/m.4491 type:complete len:261 (-) Transcript_2099:183-965(-)
MLAHLARPLLCVIPGQAEAERVARILVIGDSHANIFQGAGSHYHSNSHSGASERRCGYSNFKTCIATGASSHGLANPNSASRAGATFSSCMRALKRNGTEVDYVALMLGEVDVRFVSAMRKKSSGVSMLEQLRESRARLFRYLEEQVAGVHGFKMSQVIVMGASLLCPTEGTRRADLYVGGEKFDTSHATLRYNELLSEWCLERGCRFANPMDDLLDLSTGRVHSYFWSDPLEMHCSVRPYFFWTRAIKEAAAGELSWCS